MKGKVFNLGRLFGKEAVKYGSSSFGKAAEPYLKVEVLLLLLFSSREREIKAASRGQFNRNRIAFFFF